MRKYIYVFLIMTFVISSCSEDFIDLEPKDTLTENLAFESFADVESSLLGTYSALRSDNYLGVSYTLVPDIIADHATQTSENQGQQVFFHNWQYSSNDNAIEDIWPEIYRVLRAANTTLEQVNNFEAEQADIDRISGQALAIRAMAHFDLLRYFSDFSDRNALGVPIKLVSNEITTPARASVGEVFEQIEADLSTARTLLQPITELNSEIHLFNYDAVVALSSRVALYQEKWSEAEEFASELIQSRSLATGSEFTSVWVSDTDGNSGEIIFSLSVLPVDRDRIDDLPLNIGQNLSTEVGNPLLFWAPSQSLLSLYDDGANASDDIRFLNYFKPRPSDPSILVDAKYRGRRSSINEAPSVPGLHDYKVFRLAEQYLIRAEARANLGNEAGANSDISLLRSARISGNVPRSFSGQELLDEIQRERQRELAFEGHRWFDLKRTDRSIERGAGCETSPAINCSLEQTNFRWIFPIPQSEMFANDNMIQNSGY